MIAWVQAAMTAATLCYAAGLAVRHRNNPLHRGLMLIGFAFTAGMALALVAGVHLFGATYGPADWLVEAMGGEDAARGVLIAHRMLATVTLLLLAAQVVSGWRRHPLHRRQFRPVIALWLATYASGIVIFQ
jgi:uncharacterized membrane protein YozB (DUF420 family)